MALLDADPDLGRRLERDDFAVARGYLVAGLRTLPKGVWDPARERFDEDGLGLLVLDGVLRRRTRVVGRTSCELLGAGDLLRPWSTEDEYASITVTGDWKACVPVPVAVLDAELTARLAGWPSVLSEIAERMTRRSHALAVRMAIGQVQGVEMRIQLLFWHLADRWGRVEHDGVVVMLKPEQETIGDLVGVSRSRVNGALKALERQGVLRSHADGWLLSGTCPDGPVKRCTGNRPVATAPEAALALTC